MNKEITRRQRAILDRIYEHWKLFGEGPTPVDLADHYDIWPTAIHDVLKVLRAKGYLEESKGKGTRAPLYPTGLRQKIKRALK